MNYNGYRKVYVRRWTFEAILCYKRGCVCEGCTNSTLETKCNMRNTIFALVNKLGAPKGVSHGYTIYDPDTRIMRETGEMLRKQKLLQKKYMSDRV